MMLAHFALTLLQDPAAQNPPTPPPVPAAPPAQHPPSRDRDDRLEGRITDEGAAKPEPPPAQEPTSVWKRVNSVALIVNEEPETFLDIRRRVEKRIRDQRRPRADTMEMFNDEVTACARVMLEIQGGKDMGFDQSMIDHFVEKEFLRQVEEFGSVTKLAEALRADDVSSAARRDELYARVNSELWSRSVTGLGPGPCGRNWRDNYVRPGRALFDQREASANQSRGRLVVLTELTVGIGRPAAPGSEERVRGKIEDLRARILNGEDMGELAELVGGAPKGSHGLTQPLLVEGLSLNYPKLGEFLASCKPGDLSPILPYYKDGELTAYKLVRAEEFKLPPVPAFETAEGQRHWIERRRRLTQEERTQAGVIDLLEAAYVWPPQTFEAPKDNP